MDRRWNAMRHARFKQLLVVGTLVALAGCGAPPRWAGVWNTPASCYDQVRLQLEGGGRFSGSEEWTGPESKPGPHYSMKGNWRETGGSIELSDIVTSGFPTRGDSVIRLPIEGNHLVWPASPTMSYALSR